MIDDADSLLNNMSPAYRRLAQDAIDHAERPRRGGRAGLDVVAVYDHPSDYPGHAVARTWHVGPRGTVLPGPLYVADSLDELRVTLAARGLTRLDRHPDDDPTIVEAWL